MLVTERKVSAFTHNPALSTLLFLCREVLEEDLPWLTDINRPTQVRRIPSVLIKYEVAGLLAAGHGLAAACKVLRSTRSGQAREPPKLSDGFFKQGPRIWLCQSAGAAAPSGGNPPNLSLSPCKPYLDVVSHAV